MNKFNLYHVFCHLTQNPVVIFQIIGFYSRIYRYKVSVNRIFDALKDVAVTTNYNILLKLIVNFLAENRIKNFHVNLP